jgi:hypothetical protein
MKEYQERVVNEQNALDEKIGKLTEFLAHPQTKCLIELERLERQLRIMKEYSAVLGERIQNFK